MSILGTVPASTMKSSATRFYPGDILYGRLRPYLNKVVGPKFEGLASAEFIPITPKSGILPDFIRYRLNSSEFVQWVSHLDEGDRPRVGWDDVSQFQMQVPPTKEQQRIIEAIDSCLSRLDVALDAFEAITARLKAYRASVLSAAVEGRLVTTEADLARAEQREYEPADVLLHRILAGRRRRWEVVELNRLVASGKPPKDSKWKSRYQEPVAPDDEGLPLLPEGWCWGSPRQLFAWASGEFLPTKAQIAGVIPVFGGNGVAGMHNTALVMHPTLVIGRVGAQCGNVRLSKGPAWITDNAIYAVDPLNDVNLAFLALALGAKNLNANSGGTGQPYVNQTHLNELVIALPPAAEQERIVDAAHRLISIAEQQEALIANQLKRLQRLRQSILKWAFEGKLVDQDPSDEPADELFERISAELAARVPAKRAIVGHKKKTVK